MTLKEEIETLSKKESPSIDSYSAYKLGAEWGFKKAIELLRLWGNPMCVACADTLEEELNGQI